MGFGCACLPPSERDGCGPRSLSLPLRAGCCQKSRECVLVSEHRGDERAIRIDLCHERKRQDCFALDWPSIWSEPVESTRTRAIFGSKYEKGCPIRRPLERCRCLVRPGGRLRAAGYLARPGGPFHASRHSPCGNEKGSSFCSTLGERFRSPAA